MSDTLPPLVVFDAVLSDASCSETGGIVTCDLGILLADTSTTLVIAVTVGANVTGIITNIAVVTTATTDTNAGNDSAVAETLVQDSDGDGAPDFVDPDDDNDGMPDSWEILHSLDPLNPDDAQPDLDGDNMSNVDEYIADKDPNNPASFFAIKDVRIMNPVEILFDSSTGRIYSLQFTDYLNQIPFTNHAIHIDVTGSGGEDAFLDTNGVPRRVYRIEVGLP